MMEEKDLFSIKRRGIMFVLSSPSGAGKTTIARHLLQEKTLQLSLSVSVTTRAPRASEFEGVDYYFLSIEKFKDCEKKDFFLETAEVHGNFYGTPRDFVEKNLSQAEDLLFDIDWQGASQLRAKIPQDIVSIFIVPPSLKELENRLQSRSENPDSEIMKRLNNARVEISHWSEYDYVLINDDIDAVCASVRSIILAERFRRSRIVDFSSCI